MRFNKECNLYRVMTACFMLSCVGYLQAEEIKYFKLLDVDGKISMRYLSDEQVDINNVNGTEKVDGTDIYEFGVDIQTHSYIYHPNFLKIDIGGGPVLISNTKTQIDTQIGGGCTSATCENSVTETALNFNLRLNFLEQKPYPIAFYYDRKNPLIVPRIDEHFLQEITKYGSSLAYRGETIPLTINFEAYKLISKGGGEEAGSSLIVDDDLSQVNLRLVQNNLKNGHRELLLQGSKQLSKSGSLLVNTNPVNNEIIGSDIDARSLDFDSRSLMGGSNQIVLRNNLNYVEQQINEDANAVVNSITQLQYRPDLQWNHSKTLNTFIRADYLLSEQDFTGIEQIDFTTEKSRVDLGYANLKSNIGSHTVSLDAAHDSQTGFQLSSYGLNASLDYSTTMGSVKVKPVVTKSDATGPGYTEPGYAEFKKASNLSKRKIKAPPLAKFKVHFGLGHHVFDREADNQDAEITVNNEVQTYRGGFTVTLNHQFINVKEIVVLSQGRTQVYIPLYDPSQLDQDGVPLPGELPNPNADYEVVVVGNETQIRRLISGRITETEQIWVDYKYKAGGTFSHTSSEQQLQLSLKLLDRINVFAGINLNHISITSGERGIALQSVENRNFGVNAAWLIRGNITLGADVRFDKETKSIAPNDRDSIDTYAQISVFESAFFRLGYQIVNVDYQDNNIGNVDLTRISLSWSARPFAHSSMSLELINEEDNGSLNPRELTDLRYKLQWAFRKVRFRLEARYGVEKQFKVGAVAGSDYETQRTLVRATLERRF